MALKTLDDFPIKIRNILTGSATPGHALLTLFNLGEITQAEGDEALNFIRDIARFGRTTMQKEADAETAFERRYDI